MRDITSETITLLQLRLDSIRRQVGPVRKYRAGRKCVKGYNCGGSCITRKKNCRKALEGEAKNFSEWMVQKMSVNIPDIVGEAPVDKPADPVGNIDKSDYKSLIEGGRAFAAQMGLDQPDPIDALMDESDQLFERRREQKKELMRIKKEIASETQGENPDPDKLARLNRQYKEVNYLLEQDKERSRKISDELEVARNELTVYEKAKKSIMEHHRKRGYSSEQARIDAQRLSPSMTRNKETGEVLPPPETKDVEDFRVWAEEMFSLSGGKGSQSLEYLVKESDRQWARPSPFGGKGGGSVNVGKDNTKTNAMHEIAHHIEFEDPRIKKASNDWIKTRATGEPQKLNDLTGQSTYKDDEIAYPGNYIDPYVGKVYSSGSTEATSMALQHFADPRSMRQLKRNDPEFFHFALGILLS